MSKTKTNQDLAVEILKTLEKKKVKKIYFAFHKENGWKYV